MVQIRIAFVGLAFMAAMNCGPEVLPDREGGLFWLTPAGAVLVAAAGGGVVASDPVRPRIFVTASLYAGNLGGVVGADAKCMADAARPTTGNYKALLADGVNRRACSTANCSGGAGENIDWVLRADQLYWQANGLTAVLVGNAAGINNFGSNSLTNPFSTSSLEYWTGIDTDWRTTTGHCSNWSNGTDSFSGTVGVGMVVTSNALNDDSNDCDTPTRLLCVEQ